MMLRTDSLLIVARRLVVLFTIVFWSTDIWTAPLQQAYVKPFNPARQAAFGQSLAVSGDTLVVAAPFEAGSVGGINGSGTDTNAAGAGAAYVFVRSGTNWIQQAYLKASHPGAGDNFGIWVAVSGDTIVVGAYLEGSNATTVNGDPTNDDASAAGAAYVFVRSGTNWTQQAYLKASNADPGDFFGSSVGISGDTIVVGAQNEDSSATGINGAAADNTHNRAGAAYVFVRHRTNWTQQAYLKPAYQRPPSSAAIQFGRSAAISGDTIVVGALGEYSGASGVNGDPTDVSAMNAGAAYVFVRSGTNWSQQAYLKASNPEPDDVFGGGAVAISEDTIAVGSNREDSGAIGVNGNQADNGALDSGAAYVFARSGTNWSQQAYLKASNTDAGDRFGISIAISGNTVVVGADSEDSIATGVNGDQANENASRSGAAYAFVRNGTNWTQQAYLKASNTGGEDRLGYWVGISGSTVVAGAFGEDSNAATVNGDQNDNSRAVAGAAYVFAGLGINSPLAITSDGTGGYWVRFEATPGRTYQIERAPSVLGLWKPLSLRTADAAGVIEFHDTTPLPGQAFYRTATQE